MMNQFLFLPFLSAMLFFGCPDDPVKPCTDCPAPVDTTSHDITWQMDTLGDGNASILYDVAVVNDTLAYAVGLMYLRDPSGNFDHSAYNLAKWNGKKWEMQRVIVRDFGTGTGYYALYAVFAFGENDVWFAGDADLIHWDGKQFTSKAFFMTGFPFNGQVRKMWGTSASNLYCVGNGGAIYHYTGSTWQKIESGTTTPILDVWGTEAKIYCAVTNMSNLEEAKILTVTKNGNIDSVAWQNTIRINSIWLDNNKKIYVSGDGLFKQIENGWEKITVPSYFYQRVRGTAENNIFAVGALGMTVHYNGSTWQSYPEVMINGAYFGLEAKNKTMCAVGISGNRGVALIGKQQ